MEVIVKFLAKSTIWVRAFVYDKDGALVDPTTSIKLTLADPDGTVKVNALNMTPSEGEGEETGIYDYYYTTLSDCVEGWWSGEVWVVDGSGDGIKNSSGEFSVEVRKGL
jgi:uncharacterized protein YfaS (alpha-2-macroglobulin family)